MMYILDSYHVNREGTMAWGLHILCLSDSQPEFTAQSHVQFRMKAKEHSILRYTTQNTTSLHFPLLMNHYLLNH